jgi:starch synthase
MRILLASSEIHPYSKTGGLADMVGALGKILARRDHSVVLVTPLYGGIRERFPDIRPLELPLELSLGPRKVRGAFQIRTVNERLAIYFVDQPEFYLRPSLYQQHGDDYPDNAERFIFFSKAVAFLARHLPFQPEVVHLHDWHLGIVPLLLRHEERVQGRGTAPGTCMTIHNLAYQGLFSRAEFGLTNLPWEDFTPECAEFYGRFNSLKAGIASADILTTVSPRYAREITTPEFGCGLDGLLRKRQGGLSGILNGVDYEEWNTVRNPCIPHSYTIEDLTGKTRNKVALQKELGLPVNERVPLFGSISRLVDQKGVDIQLGALDEMLNADIQFALLGAGAAEFEEAYRRLAGKCPARVAARIGYDPCLAHRIEAGADFFLMPSRFEPCGLNQMYSLRYGTVPIVRMTGGLDDTVVDLREDPENATGIKFGEYSSRALAKAMQKALALYAEPDLLRHFQQNGMHADFSWDRTAQQYESVYERAARKALV